MEEKQSQISLLPKKRKGGGKQPGAGRPKGSTNKVDIKELAEDFKDQAGMSFGQFVNKKMIEADQSGEHDRLQRYVLGLSKYFLQEPTQKVDVTTNGEAIKGAFTFVPVEMTEWKSQ